MVHRSIAWIVTIALTLLGFGSNVQNAIAQTNDKNVKFGADYKTTVKIDPLTSQTGFVRATITGTSTAPAPFGLNSFISNTYGRLEPSNNPSLIRYTFNSDPKALGLPDNLEVLSDRYFGGSNELFGRASDTAEINMAEGTIRGGGTISIFDGIGEFDNATGTISFTQEDRILPDGTTDGVAKLSFDIRTPRSVSEPTSTTALVATGLVSVGLLVRKHRRSNSTLLGK